MNATITADAAVPAAAAARPPLPVDKFLVTLPDRKLVRCLQNIVERMPEGAKDEIDLAVVMANELARRFGAA